MIDRKAAQARLGVVPDGQWGALTWLALLRAAGHGATIQMASVAATMLPKYEIDGTPDRLAQFLATTSHETGDYTTFSENLRYTTTGALMANWPARFPTVESCKPYLRNPQALAERVYGYEARHGTRYDLGNRKGTTDAYDMRGGGWIQTTGYSNYLNAQRVTGLPLVAHPELLHDPVTSIEPACAYWKAMRCNEIADEDPTGYRARRKVNGGTIGMEDVQARVVRLSALLR